jgi:hypothetical protein
VNRFFEAYVKGNCTGGEKSCQDHPRWRSYNCSSVFSPQSHDANRASILSILQGRIGGSGGIPFIMPPRVAGAVHCSIKSELPRRIKGAAYSRSSLLGSRVLLLVNTPLRTVSKRKIVKPDLRIIALVEPQFNPGDCLSTSVDVPRPATGWVAIGLQGVTVKLQVSIIR